MTAALRTLTDADVDAIAAAVVIRMRRKAPPAPLADAVAKVTTAEIFRLPRHSAFARSHRGRCVYVLIDRGIVVYVGRSIRGYGTRYASHEDKGHDEVVIATLAIGSGARAEMAFESLEAALIDALNSPLHNVADLAQYEAVVPLWKDSAVLAAIVERCR